jgi:phosphoenolpyruvate-protein kinase (PTS system EI component)
VLGKAGRNEAEVERKHHALRQQAAPHEEVRFGIVIELVAAAFRCSMMARQVAFLTSKWFGNDVRSAIFKSYTAAG